MSTTALPPELTKMSKLFDRCDGSTPSVPDADCNLVATLLNEALALLEENPLAARQYLETARLIFGGPAHKERPKGGCLADWQVLRAKEFIRNNLGADLRIQVVASIVNLSASYFSRAFKCATGEAYSEFVVMSRIDCAKKLLLTTNDPISEVALACGFADQSHLTRMFSRIVGWPPSIWRREFRRSGHEGQSFGGGNPVTPGEYGVRRDPDHLERLEFEHVEDR